MKHKIQVLKGGTNSKRLFSFFAIVVLFGAQNLRAQWIKTGLQNVG